MGLAGLERTEDIVLRTESRWIIARNHRCPFFQASDSERLASRLYGLKVFPAGDNAYFFARKRELYGEVATNGTAAKHANFHCAFPLRTTWNAIRRTDLDGAADPDDV